MKAIMKFVLALALVISLSSPVLAQDAGVCDTPVNPPAGGFYVNNITGYNPPTPIITLQLYGSGDAAFGEISNSADFTNSMVVDVGYPFDPVVQWSIAPGYGIHDVYVRYWNCRELPGPAVIVEVDYTPSFCFVAPTPPAGGFQVLSGSGNPVTSQTILIDFVSGNAVYAKVSNSQDMSSAIYFGVGYPFTNEESWTLTSGYGLKTVYTQFTNECQMQPSAVIPMTVNFVNPSCTAAPIAPPGGFRVTSLVGSNVHTRNVRLGMFGGDAAYMEVANNFYFTGSITYPYATTLNWTLSPGYGNKTVWVRYWNFCKTKKSISVSVSFNYSP